MGPAAGPAARVQRQGPPTSLRRAVGVRDQDHGAVTESLGLEESCSRKAKGCLWEPKDQLATGFAAATPRNSGTEKDELVVGVTISTFPWSTPRPKFTSPGLTDKYVPAFVPYAEAPKP